MGVTELRALALGAIAAWCAIIPYVPLRWAPPLVAALALSARKHYLSSQDWLMAAFALWAGLSTVWAVDSSRSGRSAVDIACAAVLFVAARSLLSSVRALRMVALGYVAGCLYLSAFLLQNRQSINESTELGRAALKSANINHTGYSLAIGLVAIAFLYTYERGARIRFAWTLGLPLIVGIYLTDARGAEISALLTLTLILLGRLLPSRLLMFLTMLAVVIVSCVTCFGLADQRFSTPSGWRDSGNLNGRLDVWPIARSLILENWSIGYGAGSFPTMNSLGMPVHNAFLDVAVGMGAVGLALFIALLYSSVVSASRNLNPRDRVMTAGVYILAITPILLSGQWVETGAFWLTLAMVSRLDVFSLQRESTS